MKANDTRCVLFLFIAQKKGVIIVSKVFTIEKLGTN